jgi:hypothetical protein
MTGKLLLLVGCATVLALVARPPANDAGGMLLLSIGLFVVATAVRRVARRDSKPLSRPASPAAPLPAGADAAPTTTK